MTTSRRNKALILGCVLVGIIAVALLSWLPWTNASGPYRADATDAKIICQQFVKDQLRAPATAQFASYASQTASSTGNGTFAVHGYVDAQNGFGANIRTTYDCTVRPPTSAAGDWALVSLNTSP